MILGSDREWQVGIVIRPPMASVRGVLYLGHPFYVVRKATREEWLAANPDQQDGTRWPYYYEFSTD